MRPLISGIEHGGNEDAHMPPPPPPTTTPTLSNGIWPTKTPKRANNYWFHELIAVLCGGVRGQIPYLDSFANFTEMSLRPKHT
ncbi:hypothetical protein KIN20_032406 [Parelaphostrongylus tenuis]|uniref:Uncharacterized protein n=1 Tax=Parelaphostrongylus tenuis TaxID=148309 RepID=A0AAD5R8R8_PARTN|nr:hypothetical protein KIN20_032406 [Parelaphostrongylus tenuis]